jgi:hypothetical protein
MEAAARAAYEAFCDAISSEMSLDEQLRLMTIAAPWDELPQRLRDGWTAAAAAAVRITNR